MKRLVLIGLAAFAACKKPASAGGDGGPAAAAGPAASGWTDAKVRAYLALQQGLTQAMHPEVRVDGGPGRIRTDPEMAEAEAKLRKASGLTDDEVKTMNALTAALLMRQVMGGLAEVQAMQGELARARAEVPDGSVPEVDAALVAMTERKKRHEMLVEERARFGDALIDVALPHKEALVQNWAAMMRSAQEFGETREGEHD